MKLKDFSLFLLMAFALVACSDDDITEDVTPRQQNNVNRNDTSKSDVFARLEFPHLKGGSNNVVIIHRASFGINYCVEWDTDLNPTGWNKEGSLRSGRWTCYQMHAGNSSSNTSRKPYNNIGEFSEYPNDPDLDKQFHFTRDPYTGSGYDHGHIIASADRGYGFNKEANMQTFYMTNMQPQVNGFNAKVWATMESQVRAWNNRTFRDTLYVVKGGTIDNNSNIITYIGSGNNKIPVPKYFFMAILNKNKYSANSGYKAIGFWIQHRSSSNTDLKEYVVNIRELERLTGIDFFCNLPDAIENAVETRAVQDIIEDWGL